MCCCTVLRCFATMAFACLVATPVIAEEANLPTLTWTKFCETSARACAGQAVRSDRFK
jgi:hypothetical protein